MTITRIGKDHWILRGERIRKARRFIGMSQADLAAQVSKLLGEEISRQIIWILETGERDIRGDEMRAIASVLDQPEAWLDAQDGADFNPEPIIHDTVTAGWFPRPIEAYAHTSRVQLKAA